MALADSEGDEFLSDKEESRGERDRASDGQKIENSQADVGDISSCTD